jgi:hypothetical protein
MLTICGRATVTASEDTVAIRERGKHEINRLGNWLGEQSCGLTIQLGAFVKLLEYSLLTHGHDYKAELGLRQGPVCMK